MADYAIILSERALAEYGTAAGANISRNSTTPIRGSFDYKLAYPSGSTTWDTNLTIPVPSSMRHVAITFRGKFDATPTADAMWLRVANVGFFISTNRKLKIGSSEATMTALTAGTEYCFEIIASLDWRGPGLASCLFRVDQGTAHQINSFPTGAPDITLGHTQSKAATGPNVNLYIDDLYAVFSDSTTDLPDWLNNQTVQTHRYPIAVGTYNDFTGISQGTNKYLNVDEDPTNSDTDYNHKGDIGATKRQTFTFTNVASYASTVRGYCIWGYSRLNATGLTAGDAKQLIRHSATDYTLISKAVNTTYVPEVFGHPTAPDGSALTATILNNLEAGNYIALTDTSYSFQITGVLPNADGATYDGVWTQTGGSAGSAYTTINDSSDATYIASSVLDEKQGFTVVFPSHTPDAIGDTIYGIQCAVTGKTNVGAGTSGRVKIGVRIGGVDYLSDQTYTLDVNSFATGVNTLTWSSSRNNPSTGSRWTEAEIESAEWYVQHTFVGSGAVNVSKIVLNPFIAPNYINSTLHMEVVTGDAFTDNGNISSAGRGLLLLGVGR